MKALRATRDWSQEVLAEKSHLHRTYIAGIEAGRRNPSLRSLIKIANAFRVTVAELLDEK
jgi:transcriptional regulator with XRE-family HTH domain